MCIRDSKSGEIDSAPAGTNSDGKAAEVQDGKITVNGKDYVVRELASQAVSYTHLDVYKRQPWGLQIYRIALLLDQDQNKRKVVWALKMLKSHRSHPVSYTHLDVYKRQICHSSHFPYHKGNQMQRKERSR